MATRSNIPGGATAPRSPAPQGQASQSLNVVALLLAVRKRLALVIVVGTSAAAVVAAGVWFLLPPPKPSAYAKLYAPAKPLTNLGGEHPDPPLEPHTQVSLVKSRLVLNAALRSPEVGNLAIVRQQADPIDWLARNLTVDFSEGPEIVRITLAGEDGEQVRQIVDAVKDSYLKEIVNKSIFERKDRIHRLNEMVSKAEEALNRKRAAVRKLAEDVGSIDSRDFSVQQRLDREQRSLAQRELVRVQSDLRRLVLEEMAYRNRGSGPVELPDAVVDGQVSDDERVKASEARIAKLEEQFAALKRLVNSPETHPSGRQLLQDLEASRKEIETLRQQVRAQIVTRAREKTQADGAARLTALREQIDFNKSLEKVLQSEVTRLEKGIDTKQKSNLDLEPHRVEIRQAEELVARIKNTIATLTMEQDVPPRVLELEKAAVQRVNVAQRKMIFAAAGSLGAFGVVALLIGLLELRTRRIESATTVTRDLGLRVVGTVPKFRGARAAAAGRGAYWEAMLTESVDSTRTMLLHSHDTAAARVLMVASPVGGEGKSSLSSHLALSLARAGRRTLLIDADLRSPNLSRLFGLPSGPGLSEVLRGESAADDTVVATPVAGLSLMPAGACDGATIQALAGSGLREVFDWARRSFDFVIIDSSPVLPVTDGLLVARHADGVVISLMQGVSRVPYVEEATHRLAALGVNILGAVVNGTAPSRHNYGYGYRYVAGSKA